MAQQPKAAAKISGEMAQWRRRHLAYQKLVIGGGAYRENNNVGESGAGGGGGGEMAKMWRGGKYRRSWLMKKSEICSENSMRQRGVAAAWRMASEMKCGVNEEEKKYQYGEKAAMAGGEMAAGNVA